MEWYWIIRKKIKKKDFSHGILKVNQEKTFYW
jgi:hypothetical protein